PSPVFRRRVLESVSFDAGLGVCAVCKARPRGQVADKSTASLRLSRVPGASVLQGRAGADGAGGQSCLVPPAFRSILPGLRKFRPFLKPLTRGRPDGQRSRRAFSLAG